MTCLWFELLSRIPFAGMRLRFCRWHADACPRCLQASSGSEAWPGLLVGPGQMAPGPDLWPGVKKEIAGLSFPGAGRSAVPPLPRRSWRWAYAAAMLLLTLLAGFWALFLGRHMAPHPGPAAQRFLAQPRLSSAKIADRPARVFQVQSRNPDRVIFWIAKDDPRS
jgi:hypothetical protein